MRAQVLAPMLMASMLVAAAPLTSQAQDAKQLLKEGNQLFTAGNYEEALKVFEKGNSLKSKPVFLRSMAFCQLKLFRHEQARKNLRTYLDTYKNAKDYKKLKELVGSLDVVVKTKVDIKSTPPGAEIYIDAEAAGKVATTPRVLTIRPGKHILILKAKGYFTTSIPFTVEAQKTKPLHAKLEVPLKISSTPAGASVHLGADSATSLGKTPLETGIQPGNRKVYLKLDGFKTHVSSLQVKPATPVIIDARMQLGMSVKSTPSGATVSIDGKDVGTTPLEAGVEQGTHKIDIKLAGFKPATRTVEVSPGKKTSVAVILRGGSLLSMRTETPNAAVTMGPRKLGPTPFDKVGVPTGSHTLTVSHPDRRTWTGPLTFNPAESVTASVTLGRPMWPVWTAAGATVAGLVLGIVGTVMASKRLDDWDLIEMQDGDATKYPWARDADGSCITTGTNWKIQSQFDGTSGNQVEIQKCPMGFHHMATAGYSLAGTAAAGGLLYYLIWGRHKVDVKRQKVTDTAEAPGRPSL